MTIGAHSYGTAAGVGALTPIYTNGSGTFDTTTQPTLTQLEGMIDQVSAMMNAVLAASGFAIPVTQADIKLMLDMFVNQEAASIVEGINGSGRFGPSDKSGGKSRFELISADVNSFIQTMAAGFERMGATRTYSALEGIAYRDSDDNGNQINPIFQRGAFGNVFEDWSGIDGE
jgi:hypothetical protein